MEKRKKYIAHREAERKMNGELYFIFWYYNVTWEINQISSN